MDMLTDLLSSQTGVVALGLAALGGLCAFICAFLSAPTADSSTAYRVIYTVLNWIGVNVGKAKNADDVAEANKNQGSGV